MYRYSGRPRIATSVPGGTSKSHEGQSTGKCSRSDLMDDKEPDRGFHDVMLVDMLDVDAPVVPVADLNIIRCQWPLSVVSEMSRKQTDQESLRQECKWWFRYERTGVARLAERSSRNISPVFTLIWPSYAGAQYCGAQHGRVLHRTAWTTLGRNIPPWTVTRAEWCKAMKSHVSGVSTDVLLFSESGSSPVHHY